MAEETKSPFSARPSAVDAPVPGKEEQQEQEDSLAAFRGSAENFDVQVENPNLITAEDTQSDSLGEFRDTQGEFQPPQFEQEQTFEDANFSREGVTRQLQDAGLRAKMSFAGSNREKINFLKKRYGSDNVLTSKGDIFYRKDAKGKMKRLDPETWELLGDTVDFAREAFEEAVMLPFEAGGVAIGSAAGTTTLPIVGTVGGAVGGAHAARVAASPVAVGLADQFALALGVERDPERAFAQEGALAAGMELILPVIGNKIARFMPGSRPWREAQEAGVEQSKIWRQQDIDYRESLEELKKSGLLADIPGRDTPVIVSQIIPHNLEAQKLTKNLMQDQRYVDMLDAQNEATNGVVQTVFERVAKMNNVGPIAPDKLPLVFKNAVKAVDEAEGKIVGEYIERATKNARGEKQPISQETKQMLTDIAETLGFDMQTGAAPDAKRINELLGTAGITDKGQFQSFVNTIAEIQKSMDGRGNISIPDLHKLVNRAGALTQTANRIGGTASKSWGALTGNLRKDRRFAIGRNLLDETDDQAANNFLKSMDEVKSIKASIENASTVLNDELSADNFVKGIMSKGKGGLSALRGVKSLLADKPEVWAGIKSQWVENLFGNAFESKTKTFSASKIRNQLKDLGHEMRKEIFEGSGIDEKLMNKFVTHIERLNNTKIPANAPSDKKRTLVEASIQLLSEFRSARVNGVLAIFGIGKGNDTVFKEIASKGGIDAFLDVVPKKDRGWIKKSYDAALDEARRLRLIERIPDEVETGASIFQRAARTRNVLEGGARREEIREPLSPEGSPEEFEGMPQ